ncbi:recombination protein RecR [Candidatus Parcubacteria bacterium]|nr:recombination protein RecR [Candidatus Parcubacteria bacterium]
MNPIETLSEIFAHFPGIGPRQAKRFVYYLLSRDRNTVESFIEAVKKLKAETLQCTECKRYFNKSGSQMPICPICADDNRDNSLLMIVPRDADFEAVERAGSYKGYYFILGGSLPILEKEPERRIRIKELMAKVKKNQDSIKEIILAMNANAEGENTEIFIKETLKDAGIPFSTLGRGLSTGSELEYADPDTLKNALLHRTK